MLLSFMLLQLCLLAAVTTAHRGERVVYFDATNAFSAIRAKQLCMANYNDMVGAGYNSM
jgi:hypothetical protein